MIRYSLTCPKSHVFEAWFPSSDAYDKQVKRKLVTCPKCGSDKISKALMAPNVVTSEKAKAARIKRRRTAAVEAPPAALAAEAAPSAQLMISDQQRDQLRQLRALRDQILAKSENVGPKFADEARRIHAKEAPERGIHGEASLEDVKSLAEDGIPVFPIPVLPDDQN